MQSTEPKNISEAEQKLIDEAQKYIEEKDLISKGYKVVANYDLLSEPGRGVKRNCIFLEKILDPPIQGVEIQYGDISYILKTPLILIDGIRYDLSGWSGAVCLLRNIGKVPHPNTQTPGIPQYDGYSPICFGDMSWPDNGEYHRYTLDQKVAIMEHLQFMFRRGNINSSMNKHILSYLIPENLEKTKPISESAWHSN